MLGFRMIGKYWSGSSSMAIQTETTTRKQFKSYLFFCAAVRIAMQVVLTFECVGKNQ